MTKNVIHSEGSRPIKIWTDDIEAEALTQLKNLARLPFINRNGVACMPDVHAGIGSTVGTVIATEQAQPDTLLLQGLQQTPRTRAQRIGEMKHTQQAILVGQRRRLLNYLKKTEIERYRSIVERLGLRRYPLD